jgi:hypothetical protein
MPSLQNASSSSKQLHVSSGITPDKRQYQKAQRLLTFAELPPDNAYGHRHPEGYIRNPPYDGQPSHIANQPTITRAQLNIHEAKSAQAAWYNKKRINEARRVVGKSCIPLAVVLLYF